MPRKKKPYEAKLEPSLRSAEAAKLLEALKGAKGRDVVLDGSEVTMLGGLCLQALLAAAETARADGLAFRIADPSEALLKDAELMGASAGLNISEEAAA